MLTYGDIDDLPFTFQVAENMLGTGKIDPGPSVILIRLIGPLRLPEGEERPILLILCLFCPANDQGFSLQVVPGFGKPDRCTLPVEGVVDLLHRFTRFGICIIYQSGRIGSLLLESANRLHQCVRLSLVDQRVGRVEYQKVYLGIGQQLHVLEVDPVIITPVISVDRLSPEVIASSLTGSPVFMVAIFQYFGVVRDNFAQIPLVFRSF